MDTLDVKIEKLIYGGEGLGHAEGRTVFVPYVLPGEDVRVEAAQNKKKFMRGNLREVLIPAPARIAPSCSHFGVCGGCHYQHIPYDVQLQYKAEILRETLRRIGRVEWTGTIETHASPPLGYRNRAQWKIRSSPQGGPALIGYFTEGTTTLVAVNECPVLSPRLATVLDTLRQMMAAGILPSGVEEVEAFADADDARVLINVSFRGSREAGIAISNVLRAAISDLESLLLHDTGGDRFALDGPGFLHYAAAGSSVRVGHLSFFQVNRFLIDDLARAVAGDVSGSFAADLFAGVGLFTLSLAQNFKRVVGVDANPAAVRDLRANLDANGLSALALEVSAEAYLSRLKEAPDFVLLDPPRAGVAAKAIASLLKLQPARIAYLSCDPATLARDLVALTGMADGRPGYRILAIHLFDMFPQTYHIETLVHLERHG
jgi:23S rRNA (uracil1939-C5)-methyltransferase